MPDTPTILLVDDEPDLLEVFRERLEPEGYRCLLATSGSQALELLDQTSIDLVITDIRMPGISGTQLLQQVAVRRPDTLRMIITGLGDKESIVEAVNKGHIHAFFSKPWDSAALLHTVKSAIQEKQLRDGEKEQTEQYIESIKGQYRITVEIFQKLADTAMDAILMIDDEGKISYWNRQAEVMFGYQRAEVLGEEMHTRLAPDRYQEKYLLAMKHFRRTGQGPLIGKATEFTARHRDGHEFPIELSINSIKINNTWHAMGIVRDVSERKQAEQEIKHAYQIQCGLTEVLQLSFQSRSIQELLTRALDVLLALPSFTMLKKGVIFLVREKEEALELAVQRGLSEPMQLACARLPFGKCLCGRAAASRETLFSDHIDERHEITFAGIHPHGHYCVPILTGDRLIGVLNIYVAAGHVRKEEDERYLGMMAKTLALTIEDYRVREALRKSEEQYRTLVNNLTGAVYQFTAEAGRWRLVVISDEIEKISGYPALRFINDTGLTLESITHPGDIHLVKSIFSVSVTERSSYEVEYRLLHADGTERWVHEKGRPGYDEDGRCIILDGTIFDITDHKLAEKALERSVEQLNNSLVQTIRAVAALTEKRDPYTAGHQRRVAQLSTAIAREMGLPGEQIRGIELGATIHDIGKIYIPAEILNRPGKLTDVEFSMIKSHTEVGYEVIKEVEFPWPLAQMIRQHHERLDGSGYPDGLKGEEIILEAQIIAVADVVEAISSHRPYRPALSIEVGLEEIRKHRGDQFNADAVDVCIRIFRQGGFQFNGK